LASIFLQAVIAASMEEVEVFLSPLTARSKIREVLRGLVATRQVHTLAMGHAPHFYVAGTLPEFAPAPTVYASSLGSAYLSQVREAEDTYYREPPPSQVAVAEDAERQAPASNGTHSTSNSKARTHFARTPGHARDRKPAAAPVRRATDNRSAHSPSSRNGSSSRWNGGNGTATGNGSHNGKSAHNSTGRVAASKNSKSGTERTGTGSRTAKPAPAWKSRNGAGKPGAAGRATTHSARPASARKDARAGAHAGRGNRKPAMAAGTSGKRFGLAAKGTKKRG
jgi:hypothetical protein